MGFVGVDGGETILNVEVVWFVCVVCEGNEGDGVVVGVEGVVENVCIIFDEGKIVEVVRTFE